MENPFIEFLNNIQKLEDQFYKVANNNQYEKALKLLIEMRDIHGYLIISNNNLTINSNNNVAVSCLHTTIFMINDIIMDAEEYLDDDSNKQNNKLNNNKIDNNEREENSNTEKQNEKLLFELLLIFFFTSNMLLKLSSNSSKLFILKFNISFLLGNK